LLPLLSTLVVHSILLTFLHLFPFFFLNKFPPFLQRFTSSSIGIYFFLLPAVQLTHALPFPAFHRAVGFAPFYLTYI
jgi:hypothetical protein